jgi:dipeptidyl aminopeptidase/acylaminoacyl peptidase
LVHASDDGAVSPENSLRYYAALVEKKVPASLHIFAEGGHGFGSGKHLTSPVSNWLDLAVEWLAYHDFL